MSALEALSHAVEEFVAVAGYAAFVGIFAVGVVACAYLVVRWRVDK